MNILTVAKNQSPLLTVLLEEWGHKVLECVSARESREALADADTAFSLAIIDSDVLGGEGLDLARETKRSHGCMQVLVSSANPTVDLLLDAIDLQAEGFLQVPIDNVENLKVLIDAIEAKFHHWNAALMVALSNAPLARHFIPRDAIHSTR